MDVAMPADNPLAKAVVKSPRVERKADVKKMEKENVRICSVFTHLGMTQLNLTIMA